METLRILIAEDHPFFREGTISLLSSVPEFEVVGEQGGLWVVGNPVGQRPAAIGVEDGDIIDAYGFYG